MIVETHIIMFFDDIYALSRPKIPSHLAIFKKPFIIKTAYCASLWKQFAYISSYKI